MVFRLNGYTKRTTVVGLLELDFPGDMDAADSSRLETYLRACAEEQMEPKFVLPIAKNGTTIGFQVIFEKSEWVETPQED